MKNQEIKMTISEYSKQLELGYIEQIKCLSVFKTEVYLCNLKGKEKAIVNLK
jgi:hypothetical protein